MSAQLNIPVTPPAAEGAPLPVIKPPKLWRVLLPLLLLLIPMALMIGSFYTPRSWQYWMILAGYVLIAAIAIWIFYRLWGYARARVIAGRQKAFTKRQDPSFVVGRKIEGRIRQVMARMKQSGMGPYSLPWYLVLSASREESEALMSSSGLHIPEGVSEKLNLSEDQPDHWRLANEAVFLDMSTNSWRYPPQAGWDQVFPLLARLRPKEPINGVLLVLTVDELSDRDEESAKARLSAMLERLRGMQEDLKLNFPVYLLISGLDRVPGFGELFENLDQARRNQVLGWSDPRGPGEEFDQNLFNRGMDDLRQAVNGAVLRRLARATIPITAGRIYLFQQEMKGLVDAVKTTVESVFAPNRYIDPLPLRGVYLTACGVDGPLVTFRPGGMPAGSFRRAPKGAGGPLSWFVRDLFRANLLSERWQASRPRHVLRHDRLIKAACAALLAACLGCGAWWMANTMSQAGREEKSLAPVLAQTKRVLSESVPPGDALALGAALLDQKARAANVGWAGQMAGLGRLSGISSEIGQIHRALFQEFFLRNYFLQVEDTLRNWAGGGSFHHLVAALATYIRWANPEKDPFHRPGIEAFVDFMGEPDNRGAEILNQFRKFADEGGPTRRLVSRGSQELISHALDKVEAYLHPSLSMGKSSAAWREESQWWLDFSAGLDELARRYHSLIAQKPPQDDAPFQEAQASWDGLSDAMRGFLEQVDLLAGMMRQASKKKTGWIEVDRVYQTLRSATGDWSPIRGKVDRLRQSTRLYARRIVEPLKVRLWTVQMLNGQEGFGWFSSVLSQNIKTSSEMILGPTHQVGPFVLELFKALRKYQGSIQSWADGFQAWKDRFNVRGRIGQIAQIIKLQDRDLLKSQHDVEQIARELKRMALQEGGRSPARGDGVMGKLKSKVTGGNKQGGKDAFLEEVLYFYDWRHLSERLKEWLSLFSRVRRYHTSQYWKELAHRFTFGGDLRKAGSWQEIKQRPVFSLGEPDVLVNPVADFLKDWRRDLPRDLQLMASPNYKGTVPPEVADFVDLAAYLDNFEQNSLPSLRKAAQQFVTCVHDMDLEAPRAWNRIFKTSGPGAAGGHSVNWGAFGALSTFVDSLKAKHGLPLPNLLNPLVEVQNTVVNAFEQDVTSGFERRWRVLLAKYEAEGFADSFPFFLQAEKAVGRQSLLTFFNKMQRLLESYGLGTQAKADPGAPPAAPPTPQAKKIMERLTGSGRKEFVDNCQAFRGYLESRDLKKTREVSVTISPGEIGRHVHWVRIRLGNGAYYDLSVYGKPPAKIPMHAGTGSVTFQGLDVRRIPKTALTVTSGEYALLQLPYSWGVPQDPKRTQWLVAGQLPSVDEPGKMIPFKLNMVFNHALPEPPLWPGQRR